jgi:hypothetical protein
MRIITFSTAALALAATGVNAQYRPQHHRPPYNSVGHWRVIGTKTVNGASDSDTINVRGRDRFRQVRLCAYAAPLRLRDFDIRFANGGHQDVRTRQIIGAGSCTRVVDLNGRARDLDRIRLRYDRLHRGMVAPRVQVSAR